MRGGSMEFSKGGERFTMTNMPLGALILVAYNVTIRQLSGPIEFLSDRYDVDAKAEHPASADQVLEMLRTLLADRFELRLHRENRETPVYMLTIAKGGAKLRRSLAAESADTAFRIPARAGGTEEGSGRLIFRNESMPDLAWALTRTAGIGDRVVVDATGLDERYDFELKFARERDSTTPPDGPSIFSALPEQLGLKLEPRKAPVEFLVIDHIERPSAN
jgi:uncharacterized protein (TIGR03435 family)